MSSLGENVTAKKKYTYRGRLSPPRCWLVVYRFDPENHQGKPVVALKSGIYVNGKSSRRVIKPERYFSGTFEVLKLIHTTQKYDFAMVVSNGNIGDSHVLDDQNYLKSNSMYFGLVIDYLEENDLYEVVFGPVSCLIEANDLKFDSGISPAMLATSVVCVRLRILAFNTMDGKTQLTLTSVSVTHSLANQFLEKSIQTEQIEAASVSQLAQNISNGLVFRWLRNLQHPSPSNIAGGLSQYSLDSHTSEAGRLSPLSTLEALSNLDISDYEDLAPKLSSRIRVNENYGIYEKSIVTVGNT